jgi:hypothetical protein
MNTLTEANKIDRNVAIEEFVKDIHAHTVSNLKGTATERVRRLLEEEEVFPHYRNAMHKIIQAGGQLATLAMRKAPEMEQLKRKFNMKKMDKSGLNALLQEEFGNDLPSGIGFEGVIAHCLIKINKQIRELRSEK